MSNSIRFNYDPWLTEIIQRDVYHLVIDDGLFEEDLPGQLNKLQSKPVFIDVKVPTNNLVAVKLLEKHGFNLIDTNIVFDKPINVERDLIGHCEVRFAIPNDQQLVAELAGKSFIYSRFHLDKLLSDVAGKVKSEWANNYFLGKRGDQMVIALVDGVIVGFLQLLYRDALIIDLIAVEAKHHRKGIASDLISYAEVNCSRFDTIRVGTQIANIPSIRFYENLGFRVSGAQYVFHYHNTGE
jgi:ribosomal protein S18 acetylase RimI-like enzyme